MCKRKENNKRAIQGAGGPVISSFIGSDHLTSSFTSVFELNLLNFESAFSCKNRSCGSRGRSPM